MRLFARLDICPIKLVKAFTNIDGAFIGRLSLDALRNVSILNKLLFFSNEDIRPLSVMSDFFSIWYPMWLSPGFLVLKCNEDSNSCLLYLIYFIITYIPVKNLISAQIYREIRGKGWKTRISPAGRKHMSVTMDWKWMGKKENCFDERKVGQRKENHIRQWQELRSVLVTRCEWNRLEKGHQKPRASHKGKLVAVFPVVAEQRSLDNFE